jgi:hypothetical protein
LSYHLTLFPLPEGYKPEEVYRGLMRRKESEPEAEANVDGLQEIANLLLTRVPGLTQAGGGTSAIQLENRELELEVVIHEASVDLTVPNFRDSAREMLGCLKACVEVMAKERGYVAWDPQLGRRIMPADLDSMIRQYRDVGPILPVMRRKVMKPWWKLW